MKSKEKEEEIESDIQGLLEGYLKKSKTLTAIPKKKKVLAKNKSSV